MIIITGPGRSGTSVIARLYQELGFDPGGAWIPKVNAGLESPDIVAVNDAIIKELGIETLLGNSLALRYRFPKIYSFGSIIKPLLPQRIRKRVRPMLMLMNASKDVQLVRWEKLADVAKKYKIVLHDISDSHIVAKDPRFCWTLMVWAVVGVQIEKVLICVRSINSMVRSRFSAGHLKVRSMSKAKNSLIYGMGLCITALHTYNIEYNIIQFPSFLRQPRKLYAAMVFPTPIEYAQFLHVFNHVVDLNKVHEK